ncbi:MAG: hypothetical protein ACP5G1_04915, partial [Nanopusillaceae archaeon]
GSDVSQWVYSAVYYYGPSSTSWYGYIAPQLYSTSGGYNGTVNTQPITSGSMLYLSNLGSTASNYQYDEYINWERARAYPPNGVMPSISIEGPINHPTWYVITLNNTQSSSAPSPFQQDIAICNGNPNVGNNFAYINNVTLFESINANGSNVYFTTIPGGSPNIYSWFEGIENINGVYCA